jgi:asparagine synthase (glutamine-hydrolysing)
MCGIAGYFAADGLDPAEGRALVERMVKALDHRGPDDRGVFVTPECGLGSTRLAIVDVAGGHMPIGADGGRVMAVVNGEIYDHAEHRARLERGGHRFATRSDSEVVPQLYTAAGPELAAQLAGMFAFALWDTQQRRLLLARDRFGIKPLYLARVPGLVLFASEVKALLASGRVARRLDRRALYDVMTAGYPMPPRSMVEGVESLPPATWLTLSAREQVGPVTYWRMPYDDTSADTTAVARKPEWEAGLAEVRDRFDSVVREHLVADVEVGSYLSGGLDSVSVAARAAALGSRTLRTYSLVFPGPDRMFDESVHSQLAARSIGSNHREVPLEGLGEEDYVGTIRAMEAPQIHTVAFCLYRLAKAVRGDGLKVVLSGEGADETFAGYGVFRMGKLRRSILGRWLGARRAMVRLALRNKQPHLASSLARWWVDEPAVGVRYGLVPPWIEQWWLLADAALPLLSREASVELLPERVAEVNMLRSPLHRELAFEQRTRLEGWVLPLGDRVSMANGLEVRVPFLDHRLAELTAKAPERWLLRGLREKYLLRAAMAGRIPEPLRMRKKRAFIAPVSTWLFGQHRPAFVDARLDRVVKSGLIDGQQLARLRAVVARGQSDFANLQAAWGLNVALGTEVLMSELGLSM